MIKTKNNLFQINLDLFNNNIKYLVADALAYIKNNKFIISRYSFDFSLKNNNIDGLFNLGIPQPLTSLDPLIIFVEQFFDDSDLTLFKSNLWLRARIYEYPESEVDKPSEIVLTFVEMQDEESGYLFTHQTDKIDLICSTLDDIPRNELFMKYNYMFAMYIVVRYKIGNLIIDQCIWKTSEPLNRHDMISVSFENPKDLSDFMISYKEFITPSSSRLMAYLKKNNNSLFQIARDKLAVPLLDSKILPMIEPKLDFMVEQVELSSDHSSDSENDE